MCELCGLNKAEEGLFICSDCEEGRYFADGGECLICGDYCHENSTICDDCLEKPILHENEDF